MDRLIARYHSALIGVNTVATVHFSFVNSKDYCCYSQCPYGFVFKRVLDFLLKLKNKNKPDYCVKVFFLEPV